MQKTSCSNNKNSLERLNSSKSVNGLAGAVDTLITEFCSDYDDNEFERSIKKNQDYYFFY